MELEMPKISINEDEKDHIQLVVEPLEKGFGITIGNCLRRTLLSAFPGAAIQGIKFAPNLGVKHEFSVIDGIKEDVAEIILNLKSVSIRSLIPDDNFVETVHVYKKGPGVLTVADFEMIDDIEYLNPELVICTLDEGGEFDADIQIGNGRGYKNADFNKKDEIDFIAIDSIYSPIKKVSYTSESAKVVQNVDKDKLIFDVWTNKAYSGREVISLAAQIIQRHIGLFVNLSDNMIDGVTYNYGDEPEEKSPEDKIASMRIDEMDLSQRAFNSLKRNNVNYIGDLTSKSLDEVLKFRNLGKKTLDEISIKLHQYGVDFKDQEE